MNGVRFIPDDVACSIPGLHYLQTNAGRELLYSVTQCLGLRRNIAVADIARWRRQHPEPAVASAIAVGQSRLKAATKFPTEAEQLWAVPEALEQATSARVANYKARRIAELAQPEMMLDLCCGIGGDLLALAHIAPVLAVEISAIRAWMARNNANEFPAKYSVLVVQADLNSLPVHIKPGCFAHIDPARRSDGKRGNNFSSMHPGPAVIGAVLQKASSGVIKLSPAVHFSTLPTGHLELISEDGTVVQALLWTGATGAKLGENKRTATLINRNAEWSITDCSADLAAPEMLASRPEKWLYEVDGAVHRAGLTRALAEKLNLKWLNLDGGYLTGEQCVEHPALSNFEVCDHFIFTESELFRRLKTMPGERRSAIPAIEVKTRGGLGLDTDQLQKKLSKLGAGGYTVLIYRSLHGKSCVIARRGEVKLSRNLTTLSW